MRLSSLLARIPPLAVAAGGSGFRNISLKNKELNFISRSPKQNQYVLISIMDTRILKRKPPPERRLYEEQVQANKI